MNVIGHVSLHFFRYDRWRVVFSRYPNPGSVRYRHTIYESEHLRQSLQDAEHHALYILLQMFERNLPSYSSPRNRAQWC